MGCSKIGYCFKQYRAMNLPLLNEQRNLEQLQQRRAELEREIRLERNLTVGEPRFIGAAAVLPLEVAGPEAEPETITYKPYTPKPVPVNEERAEYQARAGMRHDEEIEAVGMRVAMGYEREQGWRLEDVSGENHGFDVRSTRYNPDGTFAETFATSRSRPAPALGRFASRPTSGRKRVTLATSSGSTSSPRQPATRLSCAASRTR
jgi:hypothetical protein